MAYRRKAGPAILTLLLAMECSRAGESSVAHHPAAIDHLDTRQEVEVFRDGQGRIYLLQDELEALGIIDEAPPGGAREGSIYYRAADSLEDHAVHIDEVSGRLHLLRHEQPHLGGIPAEELLVDVIINERRLSAPLMMYVADGELVLPETELERLDINREALPDGHGSDGPLTLHAIAGEDFALDFANLTLRMTVPPEYINPDAISAARARTTIWDDRAVPEPALSARLNYRLSGGRDGDNEPWYGARFGLGAGTGTRSCGSEHIWVQGEQAPRRLETGCLVDWPRRMLSLGLGDGISNPGSGGQAVRYGGIRLGTDFELAPGFLTQPNLSLRGTARVPSTLEVWIDQARRLRQDVEAGTYDIEDIPLRSGSGEVRLVMDNVFGRREVSRQRFYSDPTLLAQGLSNWSVELGRVREDYGIVSNEYGPPFALFNGRYGVRDWLTLEPRAEVTGDFHSGGLGATLRLASLGVLALGGTYSETDAGLRGAAWRGRFSRRGRYLSLGLLHEISEQDFVQLGFAEPGGRPQERSQVTVGLTIWNRVSLQFGSVQNKAHGEARRLFHTAGLSTSLGNAGRLSMTAFVPAGSDEDPRFSLRFSLPFGERSNASFNLSRQGEDFGQGLTVQRNLPTGPGSAYRVTANRLGDRSRGTAQWTAQGNSGRMEALGRYINEQFLGEARLRGSVLASRHGLHLSRWREGGAAIIDIDTPGVGIYHDERLAATTNRKGVAVVPGLRPYQANRLRLDVDDLPLDVSAVSTEVEVVPGRRQIIPSVFDVSRSLHLSANLRLAPEEPVPAGATATIAGREDSFPVGHGGFLYIPVQAGEDILLTIRWPQGRCSARLAVPETEEPFIDGGEVTCEEEE